jgi:demethylmenaquinone methyltransferase / 2-methoxy-6-polyprenyl-1,4-benzoquinol methylase
VPDEITAAADEHASRVREMFATIAARYDLLNHLLSGNMDKRWRRLVASTVKEKLPPGRSRILDVACGTGDLSLTLFDTTGASIVGSDFCRPMLDIAAQKAAARGVIPFVEGDALNLPFLASSFDAATIAFGLRNLANVEKGLAELLRILRPGGNVAVLEFSQPVVPGFRLLFRFYFTKLLPLIGGVVSGSRQAYEYLPDSVTRFPNQEKLADLMRQVGFDQVRYRNLTGGVAALHLGRRPS